MSVVGSAKSGMLSKQRPTHACCMCMQPREAARARSMFADGRLRLALTTERAHFFLRIRTRGVKARLLIDPTFGVSECSESVSGPSGSALL